MNISGTSVATLAMLLVSVVLVVLVTTTARPDRVDPPRSEVRAEHRSRPAPEPTAEPAPEPRAKKKTESPKAPPPVAPEQPASPTASEPTPLAAATETPAPEPVAPPVQTGGAPASGETGEAPASSPTGEPPAAEPAPRGIAAPAAEAAVTAYYAALDDRRFAAAWDALSPTVRTAFGRFEDWRAGYANTISSRASDLRATVAPGGATVVEHLLTATDRASCGPVEQKFAVTWRLIEVDGAWLAESLSATKRSGRAPATACA